MSPLIASGKLRGNSLSGFASNMKNEQAALTLMSRHYRTQTNAFLSKLSLRKCHSEALKQAGRSLINVLYLESFLGDLIGEEKGREGGWGG